MALVQLAGNMRGPEAEKSLEKSYSESLERLLWGYLRMTWSANTLSQFLAKTDSKAIHEQIGELEKRLESMPAKKPNDPVDRLAATTLDHLATSRDRLENIAHSRRKLDIIVAEIERMEAKIAAIAESAVGKLDVDDIASRVDEVAEGMRRADETMRELQLPAQFEPLDEPPQLLRQKA
jgi:methyl-accepting chemotaxis protein